MKNSGIKHNLRRAAMENNFLEAFENSNTLQEDFLGTAKANIQVNQQNKANAEKQNAANVNADAANENGYQQIIADLQKIANEQVQFDKKSIDAFIEKINNLKSLDDKSKKQINQMLNQQKTAIQQQKTAKANAKGAAEQGAANNTGNPSPANEIVGQGGNTSGAGDPSKIPDVIKNAINRGLMSDATVDDLIAYAQSLKK